MCCGGVHKRHGKVWQRWWSERDWKVAKSGNIRVMMNAGVTRPWERGVSQSGGRGHS